MRRKCILCAVAFVILCVIWLRFVLEQSNFILPLRTHRFDNFDNVTGTEKIIVPNVIHFILFGQNSLEFVSFLSILSALKVLTVVFFSIKAENVPFFRSYKRSWKIFNVFPHRQHECILLQCSIGKIPGFAS